MVCVRDHNFFAKGEKGVYRTEYLEVRPFERQTCGRLAGSLHHGRFKLLKVDMPRAGLHHGRAFRGLIKFVDGLKPVLQVWLEAPTMDGLNY